MIRSCCLSHLLQQFINAEGLYQLQVLYIFLEIQVLWLEMVLTNTSHSSLYFINEILLQLIQGCHHGVHWCLLPVLESLNNPVQGLGHVVSDTRVTIVQPQTLQPPPSNPHVYLLVDVLEVVLPEWVAPYPLKFTELPLVILLARLTE